MASVNKTLPIELFIHLRTEMFASTAMVGSAHWKKKNQTEIEELLRVSNQGQEIAHKETSHAGLITGDIFTPKSRI